MAGIGSNLESTTWVAGNLYTKPWKGAGYGASVHLRPDHGRCSTELQTSENFSLPLELSSSLPITPLLKPTVFFNTSLRVPSRFILQTSISLLSSLRQLTTHNQHNGLSTHDCPKDGLDDGLCLSQSRSPCPPHQPQDPGHSTGILRYKQ